MIRRRIEQASMLCADGIRLDADVYRPTQEGPHPVLLMRNAYGRRVGTTLSSPHPWWFADRGYIVVVQDVRGRGTSEGDYDIFAHEARDGAEAVRWAAALEGSSGVVGMIGFSYQGSAQLLAAAEAPPELKAIAPAMFGWDIRTGWAFENGAFRLSSNLTWATQVAAETARRRRDAAGYAELYRTNRAVPLLEQSPALPAYVDRYDGLGHYRSWLEEPADSRYWSDRSPAARIADLIRSCPPALMITGWYDNQLSGVIEAFDQLSRAGREVRLVVGPWAHFTWDRQVGDLDFGTEAENHTGTLLLRWFDHWLKGIGDVTDWHPISAFDLGSGGWRQLNAWPEKARSFYLEGDGTASCSISSGTLTSSPDGPAAIEWMVTDPWRPAPAHGGAYTVPAGPIDRSRVDGRPDVLTFTSKPLREPVRLCGPMVIELQALSEAASFDIAVTVSRVSPEGQAHALGEGFAMIASMSEDEPIRINLRATCIALRPDDRLRVSIAGACFPTYAVNPGTGQRAELTPLADAEIVATGIVVNGPSRLIVTTEFQP